MSRYSGNSTLDGIDPSGLQVPFRGPGTGNPILIEFPPLTESEAIREEMIRLEQRMRDANAVREMWEQQWRRTQREMEAMEERLFHVQSGIQFLFHLATADRLREVEWTTHGQVTGGFGPGESDEESLRRGLVEAERDSEMAAQMARIYAEYEENLYQSYLRLMERLEGHAP